MMLSVRPSLRYSLFGFPEALTNGSTATLSMRSANRLLLMIVYAAAARSATSTTAMTMTMRESRNARGSGKRSRADRKRHLRRLLLVESRRGEVAVHFQRAEFVFELQLAAQRVEIAEELARRGVAIGAVLLQQLEDDAIELRRNAAHVVRRRLRDLVDDGDWRCR